MTAEPTIYNITEDVLGLIGEWLDAYEIASLDATCKHLHAARARLIGGRLRTYWRRLYRSSIAYREDKSAMSLTDLARTEARIHRGNCVCCLRPGPKLGARCVDCVANETRSFVSSGSPQCLSPIKCAASHVDMVFTCVLCETSSCLECLCKDMSCSMCRHACVDCDLA